MGISMLFGGSHRKKMVKNVWSVIARVLVCEIGVRHGALLEIWFNNVPHSNACLAQLLGGALTENR